VATDCVDAAGNLNYSDGSLYRRGSYGWYWSSSQYGSVTGRNLTFNSSSSFMNSNRKAYGFSARCLRD